MKNKEIDVVDKQQDNKPKKSKKKIVMFSFLAILLVAITVGGYFVYTEYYLPSKTEYAVNVYGENNILYDTLTFKKDSYIQVLDEAGEVVNKVDLKEEMNNVTLEDIDTYNSIFKKWEFEEKLDEKEEFYKRDIIYFNAKPIYEDKNDFTLKFIADEKAVILEEDQEVSYLKKGYKKDTDVSDYFPEIKIAEDFKGNWFIGNTEIDKDTQIDKDSEIEFKTYQDKNNNNIDDFTEEFTINFVTNIEQQVNNKVVGWEETIDLPVLEDKNKVFYEWYSDKELKNKFTEADKITKDMTLYAKIKTFNEVINESVNDPIDRKDIALQVSRMLEERNKPADERYRKEIEEKEREREEIKRYNEENNVFIQDIEVEINLHNTKHNKLHLISFVDPSSEFIYSLVAPYGQTIKVVNENGNLYKEYGVRQNSTIVLDKDILLSKSSELDKYHSEYRKINDTVFIKIQPIVK